MANIKGAVFAGDPIMRVLGVLTEHEETTGTVHLPDQEVADSGKYLQTNGSTATWATGSTAAAHEASHRVSGGDELYADLLSFNTGSAGQFLKVDTVSPNSLVFASLAAADISDLGDCATLDVGTDPGEVAAGDHTHDGSGITGLTVSKALVTDGSGNIVTSSASSTEISNLVGLSSNIMTLLSGKAAAAHVGSGGTAHSEVGAVAGFMSAADKSLLDSLSGHTHGGDEITGLTASRALVTDGSGDIVTSSITSTEIGYLYGLGNNITTLLAGKSDTGHSHVGVYTPYAHMSASNPHGLDYSDVGAASSGHNHSGTYAAASHVGATGAAHGVVSGSASSNVNGFMSVSDKDKLDGISGSGTSGSFTVVTNVQYSVGGSSLQKKTRSITVGTGGVITSIGSESGWTNADTA